MIRFYLSVLFCGLMTMQAQAQATKTFLKTFVMDGATEVVLATDGQVSFAEWDQDHVRVEMTVNVSNFTSYTLTQLAEAGRYRLESLMEGSQLVVSCPRVSRNAVIGGKTVSETFRFNVWVPKGNGYKQTAPRPVDAPGAPQAPVQAAVGSATL
jgi:hypothetical protein